jgi:enoyl-CoA hydratase/carnithine racemase
MSPVLLKHLSAPTSNMETLSEIRNHIAFVTLNRPAALNALSYEMILQLDAQLRAHAADPEVRAVVIRGAGEKAFCAGGDIRTLHQSATSGGTLHEQFFIKEYQLDHYLHHFPKPYVAVMDGITMGGGMGIAQASRLRVVSDRTRIAMPEVGIGLFPDVGGSYFLSRLPGALGIYLAITGNQIRAADALYTQLAEVYWSREALNQFDEVFSKISWSNDWQTDVELTIKSLATTGLPAASLIALRPAIDLHFAKADVPSIVQSLRGETRAEYAEWAEQTVKTIAGRSPTMLAVTLKQLQLGKTMSLADCFRMELVMVRQCFIQGDIIEGVRALLIDKDNTPRWNPAILKDVTLPMIEAFFVSPWTVPTHPLAQLKD